MTSDRRQNVRRHLERLEPDERRRVTRRLRERAEVLDATGQSKASNEAWEAWRMMQNAEGWLR